MSELERQFNRVKKPNEAEHTESNSIPRDKHVAFVDNRRATQTHQRIQAMANSFSQNNSRSNRVIQTVNVYVNTNEDDRKTIRAEDRAEEFKKQGSPAGNKGWKNVSNYHGACKFIKTIKRKNKKSKEIKHIYKKVNIKSPTFSNDDTAPCRGHVLAQANGGDGSDPNNIFAQNSAVNNGAWKSKFENKMRKAINKLNDDTNVEFRVVLTGNKKIKQGYIDSSGSKNIMKDEPSSEWSEFEPPNPEPSTTLSSDSGDSEILRGNEERIINKNNLNLKSRTEPSRKKRNKRRRASSSSLDERLDDTDQITTTQSLPSLDETHVKKRTSKKRKKQKIFRIIVSSSTSHSDQEDALPSNDEYRRTKKKRDNSPLRQKRRKKR